MKVVFLDRDGVINRKIENGYVLKWKDLVFLPGVAEAIRMLNDAHIPVIVISNQACVGKGLISKDELNKINDKMIKELEKNGAHIDDIFVCPHKIEDDCNCRKPKTGLFDQAKAKYKDIDMKNSWFIGDSGSDMDAGRAAGCKTYLIKNGDDLRSVIKRII